MSDMDKYFGNPRRKYWLFLLIPLGIAAFALVMGYLVMWLWNAILPDVLGVRSINYWQAIGILALSRILFGGFGGKVEVVATNGATKAGNSVPKVACFANAGCR